ncbi:hypothetical protein ALC57_13216 [Trachymyrmex cornetzi]|uniref:Uncharacterized protein n=1 Tax=Trachymyrmex cornetzi TaxID=471704 RepID=A0A151IZT1_9HYME|nr:hypothetical protein ALC57_13216 [Trachymyrmex cornetzi]
MAIPTFVDLQGFIINKKFIVKEVAVLRGGTILTHYIFSHPMPWHFLTRFDKSCVSWLSAYHHGLRWDDGMVPYSIARRLITEAVLEEDEAVVYVKGHEKRGWLADMLDTDNIIVETLDAHYKDVESLMFLSQKSATLSENALKIRGAATDVGENVPKSIHVALDIANDNILMGRMRDTIDIIKRLNDVMDLLTTAVKKKERDAQSLRLRIGKRKRHDADDDYYYIISDNDANVAAADNRAQKKSSNTGSYSLDNTMF